MKRAIKMISLVLSVLLMLSVFSVSNPVVAAEIQSNQLINESAEEIIRDAEIQDDMMYEIVNERDRYTKVYLTKSGTKKAIISPTPIHYEKNGEWVDIDNALVENNGVYSNKENIFKAYIPEEISSDSEIEIKKAQYSLKFELEGTDVLNNNKKSKAHKKTKNCDGNFDFLNKESTLSFESVGESTNVEYSVTATGIKENIILNQKPKNALIYKYNITVENLTCVLNEDNSVFCYGEDDVCIFEIPAPIMFDSVGNISNDIKTSLSEENGKYILIYEPSYEWLKKEAEYPVTIDPVINTLDDDVLLVDSYVNEAEPSTNYGSDTALGVSYYSENEAISYINISGNSIFDYGLAIKNVSLYLDTGLVITPSDTTTFEVVAYPVISEWSESAVTYNNKPTIDTDVFLDKWKFSSSSSGFTMFDVTAAFSTNADKYNGIALKMAYTNSSTNNCMVLFSSSEYLYDTTLCPYFVVEYYETQGVEEQFDYHVQDVGRAGTVYFNDYSNQIYIERDELGIAGLNMPVQIKRYYNENAKGSMSTYNSIFFGLGAFYGYGWKTNYNQWLEYVPSLNGKEYILYSDEQGQIIYFEKTETITSGKRKWIETTDMFSVEKGYELWLGTAYEGDVLSNLEYATITDSNNKVYEFNENGLLSKINSGDESSTASINITYTDDYAITKIVDGVGREYRFHYTDYSQWSFPLLTSICAYTSSGETIKVEDDNGNDIDYKFLYDYSFNSVNGATVPVLASVTYPDGENVYYTVSDTLTTVKNIDGYTMEYSFSGIANCVITEKVYSDSNTVIATGGSLSVSKADDSDYEKNFTDANNITQTKQFDLFGRTISIINNDGTYAPRVYSDTSKACGRMYYDLYVDYETEIVTEGDNLVRDSSFDIDLSEWDISDSSYVKRNIYNDADSSSSIKASLAFTGERAGYNYAIQNISVSNGVSGDRYNFNFANRTYKAHQVENEMYCSKVFVEARNNTGNNETWVTVGEVAPNPFNINWQKYSYDFTIDFEYNEIRIFIIHVAQYGHAWYDDLSLVNIYKPSLISDSTADGSSSVESSGCTCDGCVQVDCPCTDCSDSCNLVYCNRGYSYESDSTGNKVTVSDGEKEMSMIQAINGNYYAGQSDMNGISTIYLHDENNGQLTKTFDSNQNATSYSYDAMSKLKSISTAVTGLSDSSVMSTTYQYEDDKIESINHNGFSYNYEYDAWGNATAVKVGQQPLVSYSYDSGEYRNRVNRITYGNGDYVTYTFSDKGNVTSVKSYSSDNVLTSDYVYSYDGNSVLSKITDNIANVETKYEQNNTTVVLLNDDGTEDDVILYSYGLTEDNKLVEEFGAIEYTEASTSLSENIETGRTTVQANVTTSTNEYDFESVTDYFGRQNEKSFTSEVYNQNNITGTIQIENQYGYKNLSGNQTTALVNSYRSIVNAIINNTTTTTSEESELWDWEYLYTYDLKGNITDVSVNFIDEDRTLIDTLVCSYVYDEAGQVVRENNLFSNKSYVYIYDNGGNIIQKNEYAYTTGDLGEVVSSVNYSYDSVWGDKLTAYDGTAITTDAIGNPLNMKSADVMGENVDASLEWNGRQLLSATVNGVKYEYTYNHEGLRTKMVIYNKNSDVVNTVYHYAWKDGVMVGYIITDADGVMEHTVKMLFDETGDSIGYELYAAEDNTTRAFFFLKNLQGDITAVFNEMGECVLEYSYDAWGNIYADMRLGDYESIQASSEAIIYTPITYRGYMYDYYTGLYYLQSRYYNPLYGRFLNVDSIIVTGKVLGDNLFCYCKNDPVNFVDHNGKDAVSIIKKVLELIVVSTIIMSDLGDEYSYIIKNTKDFKCTVNQFDGITEIKATYIHNYNTDEYESYDVYIKLAHIDVWRDFQRYEEHNSYDNYYADVFVGVSFEIIGIVPIVGELFSTLLTVAEIVTFIEQSNNYKYIDFIHNKIEEAKKQNNEHVYFVYQIYLNYVNVFGKLKSKKIYDCCEG